MITTFSKNNFKSLRKKLKLTQAQLAKKLGVASQSTVAMYENGERQPPTSKLPEIAKILQCEINDLFE